MSNEINQELLEACKQLLGSTWEIVIPGHPTLAMSQLAAMTAIAKVKAAEDENQLELTEALQ